MSVHNEQAVVERFTGKRVDVFLGLHNPRTVGICLPILLNIAIVERGETYYALPNKNWYLQSTYIPLHCFGHKYTIFL